MDTLLGHGSPFVAKHDQFPSAFFTFCLSFVAIIFIRTIIEPLIEKGYAEISWRLVAMSVTTVALVVLFEHVNPGWDWLPWSSWWYLAYSITVVIVLNGLIDPHMYWLRWSTWWAGDSIAIPGAVLFGSSILSGYSPDKFFDRWIFTGFLMLVGFGIAMFLWTQGMNTRGTTWADFRVASELYHTFVVWPVFTAMVGHLLLGFVFNRPNPWSRDDEYLLLCLGLFALCAVGYDVFIAKGEAPGR